MDGHFLVRQVYEDAKTYDLVGAASKVLSECKSAKFCKSFWIHKINSIYL